MLWKCSDAGIIHNHLTAHRCMERSFPRQSPLKSQTLRTSDAQERRKLVRAEPEGPDVGKEEEWLLPDEDWTVHPFSELLNVPGGYQDSLSKNTKLGKAVDDACRELDTLAEMECESLEKASVLLKRLGYKGDITAPEILPKIDKANE